MKPAIAKWTRRLGLLAIGVPGLWAQEAESTLPAMTVYSSSIANQSPVGTFTMPVSALRFDPLVDIEPRNMAEAQSDVTIRGDTFENTGLQVGALSISDPQTGHYLMELPVAPAMLGAPQVLTGATHAAEAMNSTGGSIAYDWRTIPAAGFLSAALGDDALNREELYQGWAGTGQSHLAADADWAHASGNGTVPFGDYHFDRADGRLQWVAPGSQTDLFAGYQASFFGWPNLYTPFDSDETENLETVLLALNNRENLGGGDFFEGGAFYRRNKDDYAFDRFAPLGPIHPFQTTTWEYGTSVGGRATLDDIAINYHAESTSDWLRSTSLAFGPYHSRTLEKLSVIPEESWAVDGGSLLLKAGATFDDSNRASGLYSPVAELAQSWGGGPLRRIYASYSQTTQLPSYTALDSSPTSGLFLGNPNLGRTVSRDSEIGMNGNIAGWSAELAVFDRRDDNLVDWTYTTGVFGRSANAVNIETQGVEAVTRHSWGLVTVVLGYTALTKRSDYLGADVTASFYALNYARQRLTGAFTIQLTPTLFLRMDNAARIQAPDALRTEGGNDAIVSSAGISWTPAGKRLEFSLLVDNLWNSAFQSVPGVPASRRQLSFGATYSW